ncbi:heptaprenyl diphosphate synthase [Anaerotaenia torta]|uniref:polyprenyl synthetase family protein n=1 Tax=Anaerotaenia torta TaxID=433293 RepID=UPI003D1C117A
MTNETKLSYVTQEEPAVMVHWEDALELVSQEVENTLAKSPLIIREYTKHLTSSQGKLIRARSVVLCAENEEGMLHRNAIRIAAAIELLHLATLVHDDIIDNADLRRGIPTLQKKYGRRTAVICGDYLLSTALRMAASIENKKDYLELELPDYISRVCLGELNQHLNNDNINLSVYRYLKIIAGKTAAMFEASFYAGAVLGGCSEEEAKRYRRLGFYVGMIFQLTDDCNDFEETREEANKPVQSDYEQGVITLPLIHAFSSLSDFKERAGDHKITRAEINEAVAGTGGVKFTRLIAERYYKKSMKVIEQLTVTPHKRERLIQIVKKAFRL